MESIASVKVIGRAKAVVSLYMDVALWEAFGVACLQHQTTRGLQITQFVQHTLAAWQTADATKDTTHDQEDGPSQRRP